MSAICPTHHTCARRLCVTHVALPPSYVTPLLRRRRTRSPFGANIFAKPTRAGSFLLWPDGTGLSGHFCTGTASLSLLHMFVQTMEKELCANWSRACRRLWKPKNEIACRIKQEVRERVGEGEEEREFSERGVCKKYLSQWPGIRVQTRKFANLVLWWSSEEKLAIFLLLLNSVTFLDPLWPLLKAVIFFWVGYLPKDRIIHGTPIN